MDTTTTRQMTRSPVALARKALHVARAALPAYGSKYSGKTYTLHQLFAILVLKQFFRTDYRGIVALLHDLSDLRQVLGLSEVPHYSTLCYAHQRLLKKSSSVV
jgi:(p)ppGpp synthase/HD superfamily hydrolase